MAWPIKIQLSCRRKFTPHTNERNGQNIETRKPRSGVSGLTTSMMGRVGKLVRDHDLVTAQVNPTG